MLQKLIGTFLSSMETKPPPYEPAEVVETYQKIIRILDNATEQTHIDSAEHMLYNMTKRFGFTDEQRQSPFMLGLQDRINQLRHSWTEMEN